RAALERSARRPTSRRLERIGETIGASGGAGGFGVGLAGLATSGAVVRACARVADVPSFGVVFRRVRGATWSRFRGRRRHARERGSTSLEARLVGPAHTWQNARVGEARVAAVGRASQPH